ncbi:hypothetical protein HDU67_008476 [Dinochytrium kinnereticum]|nr:hypothetical protein HDU67_008476 [Dinochytrium kinnereticum]
MHIDSDDSFELISPVDQSEVLTTRPPNMPPAHTSRRSESCQSLPDTGLQPPPNRHHNGVNARGWANPVDGAAGVGVNIMTLTTGLNSSQINGVRGPGREAWAGFTAAQSADSEIPSLEDADEDDDSQAIMEFLRETESAIFQRQMALRERMGELAVTMNMMSRPGPTGSSRSDTAPSRGPPVDPTAVPSATVDYWELVDAISGASPWWADDGLDEAELEELAMIANEADDLDMAGYEEEWESEIDMLSEEIREPRGPAHVIHVDLSQVIPQPPPRQDAIRSPGTRSVGNGGLFPLTPDDGLLPETAYRASNSGTRTVSYQDTDSTHMFPPRPVSPIPRRRPEESGFGEMEDDEDSEDDDLHDDPSQFSTIEQSNIASAGFWYDRTAHARIMNEEEGRDNVFETRGMERHRIRSIPSQPPSSSLRPGLVPESGRVQVGSITDSGRLIVASSASAASRSMHPEISALEERSLRQGESATSGLFITGRRVWDHEASMPNAASELSQSTEREEIIAYHADDLDEDEELDEYDAERILVELRRLERELRIPDLTDAEYAYVEDDYDEDSNDYFGPSALFRAHRLPFGQRNVFTLTGPRNPTASSNTSRSPRTHLTFDDDGEDADDEELEEMMIAMLRARYPRSFSMAQEPTRSDRVTDRSSAYRSTVPNMLLINTPEDLQAALAIASMSSGRHPPHQPHRSRPRGPRTGSTNLVFHSRDFYQHNRHHHHADGDDENEITDDEEGLYGVTHHRPSNPDQEIDEPLTPWFHAPLIRTPDGRVTRIEDFLLSRRLLDSNGNPCMTAANDDEEDQDPDTVYGDIESACGFDTPEGGAELLCRGLDANGDVRVVPDREAPGGFRKWEEVVEVVRAGNGGVSSAGASGANALGGEGASTRGRSRPWYGGAFDDDFDYTSSACIKPDEQIEIIARPAVATGWHEPNTIYCVGR